MLGIPSISDGRITATLLAEYDLPVERLEFIPGGADYAAVAYRASTADGRSLFVKLRREAFNETTPQLVRFLDEQGSGNVIPPIATTSGALWAKLDSHALIVFPFVEGRNGYDVELTDDQWRQLGRALRKIHAVSVPGPLASRIRRETFGPRWREALATHLASLSEGARDDSIVVELKRFMRGHKEQVLDILDRTDRLSHRLQASTPSFVLCHSDIHAGNVIVSEDGRIYIVDWDEPIFALKERDLMFAGAGLWGEARSPHQEEVVFYQGYGQVEIDPVAIAFYRYERIIEDIAVFYERIVSAREEDEGRQQSLRYLKSNFSSNSTIEIAYTMDRSGRVR